MGRRVAIFDIDGTLTDTCDVDDQCFTESLGEVFGLSADPADYDWASYPDVTDSALVVAAVSEGRGSAPSVEEVDRFRRGFTRKVTAALGADPSLCREIPGARAFLELLGRSGWQVGYATGGFGSTAQLKLETAGFDLGLPLASADDATSRQDIVRRALQLLAEPSPVNARRDPRVVLAGDAPWDLQAAADLGYPCFGVGSGSHAEMLSAQGAWHVVSDYKGASVLLELWERAADTPGACQ